MKTNIKTIFVVMINKLVLLLWPPLVRYLTTARNPFFTWLVIRLMLACDKPTGARFEQIYGAPSNFLSLQEVFERFPLEISYARPLPKNLSSSSFVFPADGRAKVLSVDKGLLERGPKRVCLPGGLGMMGKKALWVYLAPRDLHWCFAPCDLIVVSVETDEHMSEYRVTHAHNLPLNRWSCLTCRCTMGQKSDDDNESGNLLRIIMVGAFGVDDFHWKLDNSSFKPGMRVAKGAPLGHFRAGSSVLVLPWPESIIGNMETQEVVCVARTDVNTHS